MTVTIYLAICGVLSLVLNALAGPSFMPSSSTEILRHLILSESSLILGSSKFLYRLDTSLSQQQSLVLSTPNRLLVADDNGTYRGKVLTCETVHCSLLSIADIESAASWEVSSGVVTSSIENVVGIFAPGPNGTSSLTIGENLIESTITPISSFISKGDLINVNSSNPAKFGSYAFHGEGNNRRPREFLATFKHQGYVYLIARLHQLTLQGTTIVATRFCELDKGVGDDVKPRGSLFASHFEIELLCSPNSGGDLMGISAAYVDIAGTKSVVLVASAEAGDNSHVDNYLCTYSLDDINQLLGTRFQSCLDGVGSVGFTREGQEECPTLVDSQKATITECTLRGALLPGIEVSSPLMKESIVMEQTSGYFTSIVSTSLDGATFLFTGSSQGRLYQFHVQSSTTAIRVREITLDLPSDVQSTEKNVTQLIASEDGMYIYALTPRKLFRHSVDMCENYASCDECLNSPDPICGWCVFEKRCTRESTCNSPSPSLWTMASNNCPMIQQAVPSNFHIQDLLPTTKIELTTLNILPGQTYQCVFDFGGESVAVIRTATEEGGGIYSCLVPDDEDIPEPSDGDDVARSYVSLRQQGRNIDFVTLNEPVGYTDCSVHESCTPCIGSSQQCTWCPFSFRCIRSSTTCGSSESALSSSCPSIQPPNLELSNYFIHTNHTYNSPLVINAINLDQFSDSFDNGEFSCVICNEDCSTDLYEPLPAVLNPDGSITCMGRTEFEYSGDEALRIATIRVQKTSSGLPQFIDNPNNIKIILYNCAILGQNCAQCLNIDSVYKCSYCQSAASLRQCSFEPQCNTNTEILPISGIGNITRCEDPNILTFSPKAGPTDGGTAITIIGTNLGVLRSHVQSVMVEMVPCNVTEYDPGVRIQCTTGRVVSSAISGQIRIQFSYGATALSSEEFKYRVPSLRQSPAAPSRGPESGGTRIQISGTDLGIGSSHYVMIGPNNCSSVTTDPNDLTVITCVTPSKYDDPQRNLLITVNIDSWMQTMEGFSYIRDPTFISIFPNRSFASGGTYYTVKGTDLDSVAEPQLIFYISTSQQRRKRQAANQQLLSEPCSIISSVEIQCQAPSVDLNGSDPTTILFGLLMDGVSSIRMLNNSIIVHPDPNFKMFEETQQYSGNDDQIELSIEGEGFVFTDVQISIRLTPCTSEACVCMVTMITNSRIVCRISNPKVLEPDRLLTVTVHLGDQAMVIGTIEINEPTNLLVILIPVFAGVFIICAAFFIVVVAIFCRKTKQKDRRYDQLILELEKLESSVARECKLGFAELQTDLDELTGDVAGCRLPYVDMKSYLLTSLFPGATDHPVLHELQIEPRARITVERSLRDFHDLMLDKKVLLIFIHSLEEQRSFSIRDKSVVGSLLMVTLHSRLDYATEVLRSLLSELIRRTVANSYPKLLLRRTESVAEKMLTNWLAFCLHGYIMEHAGQPLYMLYRAVKNQLEKGPVDVITGEARYSLSEQKLIRQKVDMAVINATVESEDGLHVPVKVLDCDTISQAKEKLLDAVYKAAPVSQRPKLTTVDLEYLRTPMNHEILRDEDRTTRCEGSWRKINTLWHYQVQDGAIFRLIPRRDHAPPGRTWDYPASLIATHCHRQRALSEAEDGTRVWHLFKQLDVEDPKRSPFMNKKLVSEIYLPRMLSTKSILQKFVDDLFGSLFNISHPPSSPSTVYTSFFPHSPGVQVPMGYAPGADAVPIAVKYLFDFLDDQAVNARISDMDVVHTWKNNALSLRFWVNTIKNPEFVFDINKSHTVDACLSVIAQAFIDGCSSADVKLNIDSPTSKLLYNKEVQGYKAHVKRYYEEVSRLPRVPEDAMQFYLKQLSTYQSQLMRKSGGFVTESALFELLRYGIKYREPFLANLREEGLESKAQLFESVLRAAM